MNSLLKTFAKNHSIEIFICLSLLFYDIVTLLRFLLEKQIDLGFLIFSNIILIIIGSSLLYHLKGVLNETERI